MFTKRNLFIILTALVALLAIGASGILAQSDTDEDTPPFGPMMHGGMGMMYQNRMGGEMHTAIAEALGVDVETLFAELRSGKSLAELAEEKSVDLQTVYDAALGEVTEHVNAAVAAGFLTQAQADARLALMREHIAEMPMFGAGGHAGFGLCPMCDGTMGMGRQGGRHGGRMGRGA
jgi:hypothetical protein